MMPWLSIMGDVSQTATFKTLSSQPAVAVLEGQTVIMANVLHNYYLSDSMLNLYLI